MCIAIPGEIVAIDGDYAAVDILGVESEIYIGLLDEPRQGNLVLIHAGCAIKKIDEKYFCYLENAFRHMFEGDY